MANLSIGDEAIFFGLPGVDGVTHSLSDYGEKAAVAVIFTCNHCPYARAWEDRIVSIQSDYGSTGLQVLTINANDAEKYPDDDFPQMQQRAEAKGFNFPYLHDETQEIATAYGTERTPEVFLFDGDRKLAYHGRGRRQLRRPKRCTGRLPPGCCRSRADGRGASQVVHQPGGLFDQVEVGPADFASNAAQDKDYARMDRMKVTHLQGFAKLRG